MHTIAESYARSLIEQTSQFHPSWMSKKYLYFHIKQVITDALLLTNKKSDKNIVIAGWFHDLGRTRTDKGHEKESWRLVEPTLIKLSLSTSSFEIIRDCILNHGSKMQPTTEIGLAFQAADKLAKFSEFVLEDLKVRMKDNNLIMQSFEHSLEKLKKIGHERAIQIAEARLNKIIERLNSE